MGRLGIKGLARAPRGAFKLTLNFIKSTDVLNVGMAFPKEVEENAQLIRELTSS